MDIRFFFALLNAKWNLNSRNSDDLSIAFGDEKDPHFLPLKHKVVFPDRYTHRLKRVIPNRERNKAFLRLAVYNPKLV